MRVWVLAIFCSLAAAGCGKKQDAEETPSKWARFDLTDKEANQPIARVDGEELTVGEFAEALEAQGPYLAQRFRAPARRRDFLKLWIESKIMAKEAKARGLDARSDLTSRIDRKLAETLLDDVVASKIRKSDISDAEIKAFYEKEKATYYKAPEQRRINYLVLEKRSAAERALKKIKEGGMEKLRQLAIENQQKEAGDSLFFSRPSPQEDKKSTLPKRVRDKAFTLSEIGDVFPEVISVQGKFYIIALASIRGELNRSLADVEHLIREQLWMKRVDEEKAKFVRTLMKSDDIKVHEDVLEKALREMKEGQPEKKK